MSIRVLHVIGDLELGGAETLLYRLATRRSDEFEHEVVSLGGPGWYTARLAEQHVPVEHLGMSSASSSLRGLRRLRNLILKRKPDVIHSWMYLANLLSSLASRGTPIPVVWSIHASTLEHLGIPSRISARVGGLAARQLSDFVINCSQHSAREHAELGYDRAPGAVIHNGYDPDTFFPDEKARSAARASLGIAPEEFVVGTIARWHSEKDVPTFLEAIGHLDNSAKNIRCVLIGPDLDRSNNALAGRIDDRVIALGRRDDVGDLARALDLHVLSSRSEAFPNVVAETMLSGTPNVVTDVGDSAMMVGETGWVVAPQDPARMAATIVDAYREWRDRPDEWQARRSAARERIAARFGGREMLMAYQDVWKRLASVK